MQDFWDMWSTVVQLPRMQCVDSRLDHDLKLVEIRYRHLSQNQAGLRSVAVDSGLRNFSSRQMSFSQVWLFGNALKGILDQSFPGRKKPVNGSMQKPRAFFHLAKSLQMGAWCRQRCGKSCKSSMRHFIRLRARFLPTKVET